MSFNLRTALNLFAGFLIAMHIAVLLHEVGHALGSLASGRSVTRIVMFTPFPAGYVVPKAIDSTFHVWGGVAFGSLIAFVPLAMARFFASHLVLRFCVLLTAAFCFAHNGFYLLIGGFIPFGDAADMMALGTPRWVLPLLGLPLLAAFLLLLTSAIGMVGLRASDPAAKWILSVETGLILCPALMIIPLEFSHDQTATKQAMLFLLVAFAASFLWATLRARRSALVSDTETQIPQTWACTIGLFATAAGVIVFEWFALHT